MNAADHNNVVIFDDRGIPSIMCRFVRPKDTEEIPAVFKIGDKVADAIYISKYPNTVIDGRAYSMPMADPTVNITFDEAVQACRCKGLGWHLMTAVEYEYLLNQSREKGTMPHGNTDWGKDYYHKDEQGKVSSFGRTYTGTGPVAWNHDHTPYGVSDLNLESDSNSLIIEEREIKLNDGKKINLQFVSTADMQRDAKDLSLKFLPYSLLISILFSAIISLIYAKSIKNNLQEIKIVTDKMMKLDKKTRLKVSSNDEVGELKQQINDLYSTLLRTIDDLEFKNKEILKLEKLKYDFFKGASHELKTPLASLKIILENMKYNIGKYKERDIYINECIEIVDSLTKNISQILSVHSIENLNNDEEYLKINDTLEDILKKYEILANQKKITVNNYILDENIYIGKTALKIILSNLISNAVKYTDVNGVINIGIVNDWLYIENTYGNNKISNMDKIFDVKFDLNKENSNGLGLYIVSNILNNYNMEYKALQDEEFFIFKIKIFS